MISQEEFLKQLREAFAVESQEHLSAIASFLVTMTNAAGEPDQNLLEDTYRAAHSLKGAARAVDLKDVEYVCHSMESVFGALKRKEAPLNRKVLDSLRQGLDIIQQKVSGENVSADAVASAVEALQQSIHVDNAIENADMILKSSMSSILSAAPAGEPKHDTHPAQGPQKNESATPATPQPAQPEAPPPSPAKAPRSSPSASPRPLAQKMPNLATVRVSSERLDAILRKAESLIAIKQLLYQTRSDLVDMLHASEEAESEAKRLQSLRHTALKTLKRIDLESVHISQLITGLIEDAQSVLMLPCSYLFDAFPLAANDIAKSLGKEVSLEIKGQEIELEKQLLEKLKDPLMHLLRNSIDHGIEAPEERRIKGKKPRGTLSIRVMHLDSKRIEIAVADDGRGIDAEHLRQSIVEKGLASPEEARSMPEAQLYSFLFLSGFSTSPIVTDLSGRGLGLAIVKKAVEELEGSIELDSTPGQGTIFRLILPYSKASFRGNFIKVCNRLFAVPSSSIEQSIRVNQTDIQSAGSAEVIEYHDEVISIVHLADMLGIARTLEQTSPMYVVAIVCRSQNRACAFIVDEILGEQDILIKPLGTLLQKIKGIYGATVIGDNEVVPILNMRDLIQMAFESSAKQGHGSQSESKKERKRILVVEDSVTSRTLIKSILSSAGYIVQTATDGIEGFTMLKTEPFDCVVTDIEMPRLDGFGLTERIRNDPALANLPVILVTGLESREHKERGIAVGANAYITKSNFAQSNLLDTVRRFI